MRKTRLIYWLLVTALSILLSTVCSKAQVLDSNFCFTSLEMNYWISNVYDAKSYKLAYDSINKIVSNKGLIITSKDFQIKECEKLIASKQSIINLQNSHSDLLKKQIKKERFLKSFWRSSTGIVSIASISIIGYQAIKK